MNRSSIVAAACAALLAGSLDAAEIKIQRNARGELVLSNDPPPRSPVSRASVRPRRGDERVEALIERYASRRGLEAGLVRAVIQVESAFDPRALSVKGAMGLMQLMPETAREVGVDDPWDPEQNVRGGTLYLRRLLDRFDGQLDLALAGYNAGPGAVERYGGVPPYRETVGYVDKVLRLVSGRGWDGRVGKARRQPTQRSRPVFVQRDANNQIVLVTN